MQKPTECPCCGQTIAAMPPKLLARVVSDRCAELVTEDRPPLTPTRLDARAAGETDGKVMADPDIIYYLKSGAVISFVVHLDNMEMIALINGLESAGLVATEDCITNQETRRIVRWMQAPQ